MALPTVNRDKDHLSTIGRQPAKRRCFHVEWKCRSKVHRVNARIACDIDSAWITALSEQGLAVFLSCCEVQICHHVSHLAVDFLGKGFQVPTRADPCFHVGNRNAGVPSCKKFRN